MTILRLTPKRINCLNSLIENLKELHAEDLFRNEIEFIKEIQQDPQGCDYDDFCNFLYDLLEAINDAICFLNVFEIFSIRHNEILDTEEFAACCLGGVPHQIEETEETRDAQGPAWRFVVKRFFHTLWRYKTFIKKNIDNDAGVYHLTPPIGKNIRKVFGIVEDSRTMK